jgi:hypothetical protein
VTVIPEVLTPSAVMLVGDATIVASAADAAPGTNSTDAVAVASALLTVNDTTLVSAAVDDVNVAVYVPSPLSVSPEIVPAVGSNTIASPPVVRRFPFASNRVTVISEVLTPSAVMLVGDATIVASAADAAPGTNSTVAVAVASVLLTVNDTTLVSAVVEDVRTAE